MISENKDTEIRLLNEKSSNIKIGDIIRFKVLSNEEIYVDTKVVNLTIYNNIEEVWEKRKNLLSTVKHLRILERFFTRFTQKKQLIEVK